MFIKLTLSKFVSTLQKVVQGWDVLYLLFVIVFFPWSIAYIALRMVQEWDLKGN
jgi:hypothetical protein